MVERKIKEILFGSISLNFYFCFMNDKKIQLKETNQLTKDE